jgi:ribosomal protein S18 acetylase RimI-like enzyme
LADGLGRAPRVRSFGEADTPEVARIFGAVVAAGETFAFAPETRPAEALGLWRAGGARCYVAELDGRVVGSYVLRANHPGLGAHVANASFMVDPEARGRGIGRLMGEHALAEAAAAGFRAMQFNLVVASNSGAIGLWRSLGFEVIGRLPEAFHWRRERYVDALVMFRTLAPREAPEALLPFGSRGGGPGSPVRDPR